MARQMISITMMCAEECPGFIKNAICSCFPRKCLHISGNFKALTCFDHTPSLTHMLTKLYVYGHVSAVSFTSMGNIAGNVACNTFGALSNASGRQTTYHKNFMHANSFSLISVD